MKPEELRKKREQAAKDMNLRKGKPRIEIRVAMGTSGIAAGSRAVLETFQQELDGRGLKDVRVVQTGERGWTSCEPVAEVVEHGKPSIFYSCLNASKVKRVVQEHIVGGKPVAEYRINPAGLG